MFISWPGALSSWAIVISGKWTFLAKESTSRMLCCPQCRFFLTLPLCLVILHLSCFCSPSDQWPSETGQTPWAPSWLWQLFYHDEQWAGIQQLHRLWRRWQHKQVGHCHSDWAVNAVCVFPSLLTILGFLKHADWPVGWFITSLSFFLKNLSFLSLLLMIWALIIHQ